MAMPEKRPVIGYQKPQPSPERWQLYRVVEILAVCCVVAALWLGLMSLIASRHLATPTPEYKQYEQMMRARAATLPAGAHLEWHYSGQAYVPRPLFSLATTYYAIAFAGAGVAIIVVFRRGK
jgi:hypothetical protein